ncbi:hypothetical protein PoB_002625900 [Plakobranchus ocellatus]|uniref:Uncharacterized protein n=1 Tax=Plakobranchus ocellatus TaxID=259542 RepID=A0AAV3ZZF3_9GAST|nr:hypothetical protein PoB_002625900 [Plakobranchus ocellatus]
MKVSHPYNAITAGGSFVAELNAARALLNDFRLFVRQDLELYATNNERTSSVAVIITDVLAAPSELAQSFVAMRTSQIATSSGLAVPEILIR